MGAHRVQRDSLPADGLDGAQHLDLFVAQWVSIEGCRRFHGYQRHQLQQVVLEHIAHHPHAVVVARTVADAYLLGYGDLDRVDVIPVPYRLEYGIGKAGEQDVLDGLLAEIMVDAVDLILPQHVVDQPVELAGRSQVGAKGFFDHYAPPAAVLFELAGLIQIGDDDREQAGWYGVVIQAVRAPVLQFSQGLGQFSEAGSVIVVASQVVQARGKQRPLFLAERIAGELFQAATQVSLEGSVRVFRPPKAEDLEFARRFPFAEKVEERRDQLTLGQIAGSTEDHDRSGNLILGHHHSFSMVVNPVCKFRRFGSFL